MTETWEVADVSKWLMSLGIHTDISAKFEDEEINGEALLVLNEDYMKNAKCLLLGSYW